ncbi:Clp1-like protein [Rhodotorula diobovata]|uniref:Clp1-like protein n=1 Tax=Rhodotorula diobovata TaxID=5288 RepID=A0A5C5FZ73_9BASI|nr:Clp1-like protein [Rhodotorula diobovata]
MASQDFAGAPPPIDFPPFVSPDNGRLRIPTTLPPDPRFHPVTPGAFDPDDELQRTGASVESLLASLQRSAQQLFEAENSTTELVSPQASGSSSVAFVRCRPPRASAFVPTHVLELHFTDTGERYRTPVHGALWGLQSPPLAAAGLLRSRAPLADADCILLPLVPFDMPHRPAWPILHRYLYDGSVAQLLSGLLGEPGCPARREGTGSPSEEEQQALDSLLVRLMRVREVWLNAARLEMSDRQLWGTLRRAWMVLVAQLGEVASHIPGSMVPRELNGGAD